MTNFRCAEANNVKINYSIEIFPIYIIPVVKSYEFYHFTEFFYFN